MDQPLGLFTNHHEFSHWGDFGGVKALPLFAKPPELTGISYLATRSLRTSTKKTHEVYRNKKLASTTVVVRLMLAIIIHIKTHAARFAVPTCQTLLKAIRVP